MEMKNIALLSGAILALTLGAVTAMAQPKGDQCRGVSEQPMMMGVQDGAVAQVEGSEGKICEDGRWKVELKVALDQDADKTYPVCLYYTNVRGDVQMVSLAEVTVEAGEDELKGEGNLFDSPTADNSPANLYAPIFVVKTPGGSCGDGNAALYQSGLTIME